jgi:DnaJ-class molecular chaperone
MPTERDYYDILGIDKKASGAEIKKAYRKKALEFHPDRNKAPDAEAKFKEVNEAYEVLSNPQKKTAYDQYGHAAFQQGGGFAGQNPFSGFGGNQSGPFSYSYTTSGNQGFDFDLGGFSNPFDIFEQFFGGASPFTRARSMPRYSLGISFMESVKGVEKEVVIEGKNKKIKIPAGVADGSRIRFNDFYLIVEVQPDPVFHREGDDVIIKQEISLKLAILGGVVEVPTIDGDLKLRVRPGTQSGTTVRLKGKGAKRLNSSGRGDEYVHFIVKIPEKLSREQREAVELFDN